MAAHGSLITDTNPTVAFYSLIISQAFIIVIILLLLLLLILLSTISTVSITIIIMSSIILLYYIYIIQPVLLDHCPPRFLPVKGTFFLATVA